MNGETLVERDEDILDEFKEFVQALKRVGIDYSIIVNVEGGKTQVLGQQRQVQPISESAPQRRTQRER
ncbi:MAG TPA: hypothetical protein VE955_12615 [Candidatus Dormibacteraeota bacterium]|nr:hypothetical protein [Candidatus Dormibacteraeota bacterium]